MLRHTSRHRLHLRKHANKSNSRSLHITTHTEKSRPKTWRVVERARKLGALSQEEFNELYNKTDAKKRKLLLKERYENQLTELRKQYGAEYEELKNEKNRRSKEQFLSWREAVIEYRERKKAVSLHNMKQHENFLHFVGSEYRRKAREGHQKKQNAAAVRSAYNIEMLRTLVRDSANFITPENIDAHLARELDPLRDLVPTIFNGRWGVNDEASFRYHDEIRRLKRSLEKDLQGLKAGDKTAVEKIDTLLYSLGYVVDDRINPEGSMQWAEDEEGEEENLDASKAPISAFGADDGEALDDIEEGDEYVDEAEDGLEEEEAAEADEDELEATKEDADNLEEADEDEEVSASTGKLAAPADWNEDNEDDMMDDEAEEDESDELVEAIESLEEEGEGLEPEALETEDNLSSVTEHATTDVLDEAGFLNPFTPLSKQVSQRNQMDWGNLNAENKIRKMAELAVPADSDPVWKLVNAEEAKQMKDKMRKTATKVLKKVRQATINGDVRTLQAIDNKLASDLSSIAVIAAEVPPEEIITGLAESKEELEELQDAVKTDESLAIYKYKNYMVGHDPLGEDYVFDPIYPQKVWYILPYEKEETKEEKASDTKLFLKLQSQEKVSKENVLLEKYNKILEQKRAEAKAKAQIEEKAKPPVQSEKDKQAMIEDNFLKLFGPVVNKK